MCAVRPARSNLVLQSNAAINRYLLERQQLHKDLALLRKHKVRWG